MAKSFGTALEAPLISTPAANPPSGKLWLYLKSDGFWYSKNSAGSETRMFEPPISGGTTGQYWRGDKTFQTLDKTAVGLSNVDNTSDAAKPVSTATTTALGQREPTITPGTTTQYWRGDKTWQTLDKSAVGLSNVDNTSDASKPVSSATQTALNAKEPTITSGTTAQYWRGDKTFQTLNPAAVGLGNVPNVDATNASNSSSGTLPDARFPERLGIGGNAQPAAGDWNNAVNTGWYSYNAGANMPAGVTGWFIVMVQQLAANPQYCEQWGRAGAFGGGTAVGPTYRRKLDGNVWGPWTADVLTTDSRLSDSRFPSNDVSLVHLAGSETVTGLKNFTGGLQTGGQAVVATNDGRLSDTRTPTNGSVTFASLASSAVAGSGVSSPTALVRADDPRLLAAPTNLIANPDFENLGSDGRAAGYSGDFWQIGSGSTTVGTDTTPANVYSGNRSLKVSMNAVAGSGLNNYSDGFAVTPGATLTIRVMIKSDNASTARYEMDLYYTSSPTQASPSPFDGVSTVVNLGGALVATSWQMREFTFQVPPNVIRVSIDHGITTVNATACNVWVDNVVAFQTVPTSLPYLANGPYFHGRLDIVTAQTVTTDVNIPWLVKEDPDNRWNATNRTWTIPVAGLYRITFAYKWNGAAYSSVGLIMKNGLRLSADHNPQQVAYAGSTMVYTDRFAAGDSIATMVTNGGYASQPDNPAESNYVTIEYVGQGQGSLSQQLAPTVPGYSSLAVKQTQSTLTAPALVPDLTQTFNVQSTADVFMVHIHLDVQSPSAGAVYSFGLGLDGAAASNWHGQGSAGVTTGYATSARTPVVKTYRITGLTPGSRSLAVWLDYSSVGSVFIYNIHSTFVVEKVATGLTVGVTPGPLPDFTNTNPAAPTVGAQLFSRFHGRHRPAVIGPQGQDTVLQPHMGRNRIVTVDAVPGTTTVEVSKTAVVVANAGTTTATAVIQAASSFFGGIPRFRVASTATAGTGGGIRLSSGSWWLSSTANAGGFDAIFRFGLNAATATNRVFVGMTSTSGAMVSSAVNPSTFLSMIGFGADSTDTTLQFMCNDATGTATKVNLGASFPIQTSATDFYEVGLFAPSGVGTAVYWYARRLNDGAFAQGTATTDLPAINTLLNPQINHSNGTTAAVASTDIEGVYIESDN